MRFITALSFVVLLSGCAPLDSHVTEGASQLQLRQIQTREYDAITKERALRAVLATMQDLDFVIDKADLDLGSVTGTRLSHVVIKMTVIVRERGADGVAVRANANLNDRPVESPESYQSFFTSLDKSIFLLQNKVD
ncbi:MAG: hypothetical protein HY940_02905 [Gammaproteobacteria bacterium]|nr:hypothetical protein [Gammaproteobacteria bacterium]